MPRSVAPAKQRPATKPTILPSTVGSAPTFGQSIKDGVGLGIGSAIGSRIVSSIFGAPAVEVKHHPTPYEQCIALHKEEPGICAPLAQSGQRAQSGQQAKTK